MTTLAKLSDSDAEAMTQDTRMATIARRQAHKVYLHFKVPKTTPALESGKARPAFLRPPK